ncbi:MULTISPECIES: glycosyltransferase [Bacillus]|uniref:glycosyltransferase n=1 Tax=Bacillus TaxID=1386 RepID=UPI001482B0B8|nr:MULTISPECIES: glycosyltransferase [Bacillus]MDH4424365.1 glycosyltransferase [Bacillus cereus]
MRKIGVYFLNLDYGEKLTGIEISSLKRAQIFDEFLNYDIKLLSLKYRRTLDKCRSMYLDSYRLSNKVNFANLYGDFQHSENRKISKHVSESIWSAAQEPNQENVVKVINENKEVIKYIVYDEKDKQKINYINNFIHGKKYMKELFDEYGTLSSKQYFDDTQKIVREEYYRTDGTIALVKDIKQDIFLLMDECGNFRKSVTEEELIQIWITQKIKNDDESILFVDKNRFYYHIVKNIRNPKVHVVPIIHSTFYNNPSDKLNGALNSNYIPIWKDFNQVEKIVVLTGKQKQDIANRFGGEEKLAVIPHSISGEIEKVPFEKREKNKCVLFARLSPEKQIDKMVGIFTRVVKKIPSATLHIYGEGKEKSKLIDIIKRNNMEKSIFIHPFTFQTKQILNESSCFLLTSRNEGFCLAAQEAIACGCPVIYFDIDYLGDYLRHGENSMKVEADNMEQFAEKVIELLQHDQTRERYSENSYEVIKEFTGAIVSKQWESLIKDLLLTTPNN